MCGTVLDENRCTLLSAARGSRRCNGGIGPASSWAPPDLAVRKPRKEMQRCRSRPKWPWRSISRAAEVPAKAEVRRHSGPADAQFRNYFKTPSSRIGQAHAGKSSRFAMFSSCILRRASTSVRLWSDVRFTTALLPTSGATPHGGVLARAPDPPNTHKGIVIWAVPDDDNGTCVAPQEIQHTRHKNPENLCPAAWGTARGAGIAAYKPRTHGPITDASSGVFA